MCRNAMKLGLVLNFTCFGQLLSLVHLNKIPAQGGQQMMFVCPLYVMLSVF